MKYKNQLDVLMTNDKKRNTNEGSKRRTEQSRELWAPGLLFNSHLWSWIIIAAVSVSVPRTSKPA